MVIRNGKEEGVPAWGNRTAFRVPKEKFQALLAFDKKLPEIMKLIDRKIKLLGIQSKFILHESNALAADLQNIVDQEKIFEIIPKTLNGFYKACFLMDRIRKYPDNFSLWLIYGSSLYSTKLHSRDLAKLIYSLDFLYSGSDDLEENVLNSFVETMQKITNHILHMQNKNLQTCVDISPREETINFLFAVNLYEDITQELRYLYGIENFSPIRKIFQSVENIDSIFEKS